MYEECWCHYIVSVQFCGTVHCLIPFSVLWIFQVIVTLSCVTRKIWLPSPSLILFSSQTLHLVQFALCFGGKNIPLECLSACHDNRGGQDDAAVRTAYEDTVH